jgi:RNA polymerase sigma factor (sigma-70 family)
MADRTKMTEEDAEFVAKLCVIAYASQNIMIKFFKRKFPFISITDADDILQDALLKALKSRSKFDAKKGTLESWFARIVQRSSIDFVKNKKRQCRSLDTEIAAGHLWLHTPDTEYLSDRCMEMLEIVDNCSDEEREILKAVSEADGGDWTAPIVERSGVPAGTLRTRASRLLHRIRDLLLKKSSTKLG